MSDRQRPGFLRRWCWVIAGVAVTLCALLAPVWLAPGPRPVVYSSTDFAHLPVSAAALTSSPVPASCVSVQQAGAAPVLVDQACGSPSSTFRVVGRVGDVGRCVPDADLTYAGPSGALCLDYDWTAGQCLAITSDSASKVPCTQRGAVSPELAIIGAVDVSYCREGGIAHSVRHFTICTVAGDKNCAGKPRAS